MTLKDTEIENFGLTEKLREIRGIQDCVVYQKAMAKVRIPDSWQSDELAALGGPAVLAGQAASGATDAATAKEAGAWLAEAPIVILDDDAFRAYCKEIGITPRLDGTIILNQIWDSLHSNFRHRIYVPYGEGSAGYSHPAECEAGKLPGRNSRTRLYPDRSRIKGGI